MRWSLLAVPVSLPALLRSAEPALTHLHPAAFHAGATVECKAAGKFDPWPCRMWCDAPGIVITAGKEAGSFSVRVSPDIPPGPHLVRAVNDEGASAPVAIMVSVQPQTGEQEPNDDFRRPQVLQGSDFQCNGRLDKNGDVDSWQIAAKQGQILTARIEANVLAAAMDAMLRIVDDKGTVLAFNHDFTSMDPFIAFTVPRDGNFVVQVMAHKYPASSEINFTGGPDCIYRLHLSTGPVIRYTWPLCLTRNTKVTAGLAGWNLTAASVEIDPAVPPTLPVTWSDLPERAEGPDAAELPVPGAVSGRLEKPGEEDRYSFAAKKGEPLILTVSGGDFGSLVDPLVRILDKDGREVAAKEETAGSREPVLTWTPPADGAWTAAVRDLTRHGGPDYYYRLAITRPMPEVRGIIGAHALKLEAGKPAEVKVSVTRLNGFAAKLKLSARDLPAGVMAADTEVPDKNGEVVIKLSAAADAPRSGASIRLVLADAESGREHAVIYQMISVSENNGVPQGYQKLLIDETPFVWLTVVPMPPAPPPAKPAASPGS